jgi:transcriptional regulator with XRE-family HTH domain
MELTPVVRDAVVELVGRLGFSEASRRSGVSRTTMKELRRGRRTRFSRRTVARVLAAVREARATGEMRHKASVRHGASVRRPMIHRGGRPASKVTLEQAAEIRRRVESGASLRSVAGDFGICRQYVSRIARGEARTGEPFIRLPGKERKVRRISEQAGPVYPELEARSRAAESGARSRQREEIRREQEQREQRLLDLPGY